MKRVIQFGFAVASMASGVAIAEPLTAGVTKLSGKTQSECMRTAEAGLNSAGFPSINRGKNSSGQPGTSFFATDKPYYAVVFCEGETAFVAVSGPDATKRSNMHGSIVRALRQ